MRDQANGERRRIFFFRPTLSEGGADRVTVTLLRHLDRRLFDPTLVLVKRDGALMNEVPVDVPVIDLGVSRLRFSWMALASILRRERPDILLSTSSGGNLIASLAHTMVPDSHRRLILSERNTFSSVRRERRPRWLPVVTVTRHLYKRASRIIAVSGGVAQDLLDCLGLPEELVTAIPNPVVDDELHALAKLPVEHPWFHDDIPVLLAVGRLVSQKDYPVLLRAFRVLRDKRVVRLIILGEGELREELEEFARALKVEEDVNFPGFMKNPFPFMRNCTVYILCSRFEGLPGALIQAMACGAPSISTDCPSGPSEIIDSGSNGLLVPVGDVQALARSIELLLDDSDLRRSFSEAGRETSSAFRVSSMIRMYEEELLDCSLNDSGASHEAKAAS